jgi:hypothetical protein
VIFGLTYKFQEVVAAQKKASGADFRTLKGLKSPLMLIAVKVLA